ncbi:MAG: hypothetical protein K1W15_04465 [Lachnospiraceae bacterium]|jgi:hypothetical protein
MLIKTNPGEYTYILDIKPDSVNICLKYNNHYKNKAGIKKKQADGLSQADEDTLKPGSTEKEA